MELRPDHVTLGVESFLAGPLALRRGKPGQVGNEAATVTSRKCRGPGSPFALLGKPISPKIDSDRARAWVGASR